MDLEQTLPKAIHHLSLDGRDIYLLGTAHVSKKSVREVKQAIEALCPQAVCVELCSARYKIIQDPREWRNMDIYQVIRQGKSAFLLAQLIMTSFYKKIGEQLGVQPGAEMAQAISCAKQVGAELILIDREIEITLKRVWANLNLWHKLKMLYQLLGGLLVGEKIDYELVEKLKQQDYMEDAMECFARQFPSVKKILIDERDTYLAQKIRHTNHQQVVAVIGAAHVEGIIREIAKTTPLEPLCQIPPPSLWPKVGKWLIPLLIIALIGYGFFKGGTQHSVESILIWILINGILSAIGAALAFGHPATVISAFIAAPITSLNPMIAAGWVAGLVQAWVKKPTVDDLENLPQAISSVKGFWTNPVSRILLVVVLANLGSSLGTFIAGGWIAGRVL